MNLEVYCYRRWKNAICLLCNLWFIVILEDRYHTIFSVRHDALCDDFQRQTFCKRKE